MHSYPNLPPFTNQDALQTAFLFAGGAKRMAEAAD